MYFVTYLRRELRRRMRQSLLIALGLALGVGLVVTVASVSAGVRTAQSSVLSSLYGVGTDVTVTGATPTPSTAGSGSGNSGGTRMMMGPNGAQICTADGRCSNAAGQTVDNIRSSYDAIDASKVSQVAGLHDVAAAAGVLSLSDMKVTFPSGSGGGMPQPDSVSMEGVDTAHLSLGPLSSATLASGHALTASDADSADALVDSAYAQTKNLTVGSTLTIDKATFTVIGIVDQAQGSNPPQVYIPLAKAQAYTTNAAGALTGKVNTIYVTAASSADIATVQSEVSSLLPGTTITTASSLAGQVTGSLASTATLANDLGTWLSILVLIAAFTVACLLTMSAVARRSGEFGTLKAIGWRSRRIITQVLGESVAVGIAGAAAGIGLGYAGSALIAHLAPPLSATVGGDSGAQSTSGSGGMMVTSGGVKTSIGGNTAHTVSVILTPQVTMGAIALAVVLAIAGGLLAGAFGSWRIAGLRPVDALARVA